MKRLILLLALLWALPAAAQIMPPSPQFVNAVSSGVTVCTSGNCATWTIPNTNPSTTMQITGTMTSMTLTFEATADGQTWFTVGVRKLSDGSLVTTTTGTGQFAIPNSGIVGFRARCTTYASGGANVSLTRGVATASASLGGASLPGSFTVGDLLTANSTTTLTNLPDVATGQVLASGGVGVVPAYTTAPTIGTSVTTPLIIGGSLTSSALEFRGSSNTGTSTTPFAWSAGNNGATVLARLFSAGVFAVSNSNPVITSLGSGGVYISAFSAAVSGGFQGATNVVTTGSEAGYIDFGTLGTASAEKRVGAIHGFLSADSTTIPTGELRFYTTNAGTIAEKIGIPATGGIRFNSTRALLASPADAQFNLSNNAGTTGVGLQTSTADTLIVANLAQNAYGTTDSGKYKIAATLWESNTAPTIASGGCTSPAVTHSNGTAAFLLTLGSSCAGVKTITLTLPAAAHFWMCDAVNNTGAQSASNVVVGTATSTTAVALSNYSRTTGLGLDYTAADTLLVKCAGE